MIFHINKPGLEEFISNQVRAGNYPSPDALIEAAVERMMLDAVLDDEVVEAINRADVQYRIGQFVDWRDVRDDLRRKYTPQ